MKIKRPTSRPDLYTLTVDETMLLDIIDGLRVRTRVYRESVREMIAKELNGEKYPNGTNFTADEDLYFLYSRLSEIHNLIFKADYMKEHPEEGEA